jgi:twinkle protein
VSSYEAMGIDLRGKASGEVKTTCPRCSQHRKKKNYPCLNVNVDEGVWNCWHCGWTGSLKQGEMQRPVIAKAYRKPDFVRHAKPVPDKAVEWFAKRGIPQAVLQRNMVAAGISYFPQIEEEKGCVMFPYRRRGEVVNVKYRTFDKLFRMEGGCERVLYGLDDIGETLFWVEGEIDKLSLEVAGMVSCVSVPDGAPAPESKSYESKFDFLDAPEIGRASVHVIAVDNDPPGIRLRDELIRRLGPDKCRIVDWPDGCKDANDVLVQFGVDVLLSCLNEARELPIVGALGVNDYIDDIQKLYREGVPRGVCTGWSSLDKHYNVRAGDVTVVTGAPNSGKSEWLDALMVNLAGLHGWRFGVYSPEQGSPAEHIAKLVEKYSGMPFDNGPSERISSSALDSSLTWIGDRFTWIAPEQPTLRALLYVARQLVLRRGVRGLVFDPWNEIEHSRPREQTETEYVGESLREIRLFAKANAVHIWIVAHPQKLQKDPKSGQYPVAGPYEISGSANWHNKPDVCISVWRERRPDAASTTVDVHVQKVRSKYVGRLGMVQLRWDRVTGRYSDPAGAERYRRKGSEEE